MSFIHGYHGCSDFVFILSLQITGRPCILLWWPPSRNCRAVTSMAQGEMLSPVHIGEIIVAMWRHRLRSELVQLMTCCLLATSHYLNQCWLTTMEILGKTSDWNFSKYVKVLSHNMELKIMFIKGGKILSRPWWLNICCVANGGISLA